MFLDEPVTTPTTAFSQDFNINNQERNGESAITSLRQIPRRHSFMFLDMVMLSVNICEHPVGDSGICDATFMRYTYRTDANRCIPFAYTGCAGNGNNFLTERDCTEKCVITLRGRLLYM